MNLENVKVGDWIKVQVTEIDDLATYPIQCGDECCFTREGAYIYDEGLTAFPVVETERWMMVSVDGVHWSKRKVIAHKNGGFLAWNGAETDEQACDANDATTWRYAKEIEKKVEVTLEQVAKAFGTSVENLKINCD